ncbi:MAG: 23S rRNA (adenine(2503)-C(2))-methyltransferase RlmN [Lachnospiraceae bacterium]|nr:23S rRNA (adenine(2503)-C(2))-methyltransferase RlmN [Lachnospiraceae bacterium]
MEDISSKDLNELKKYLEDLGEKPFRAKQIYKWLHQSLATDFSQMTDLSKALREKLLKEAYITVPEPVDIQISKEDGTRKYLFRLPDDSLVESVLMKYRFGWSVCISSQVGCRMGCAFCASGMDGLLRGLTPGEMLGQIEAIQRDVFTDGIPKPDSEEYLRNRISHVVVMGTGEPLDNYDNLLIFIRMLTDENGLHISQRNLTVSTCGIVPRIKELAEKNLEITLALSLHAPTQEKRRKLMPVANKYDISDAVGAMKYYQEKTGRRVTFEYSLIKGVNDTDEDARELSELLWRGAHINLIPVNPVKERTFTAPTRAAAMDFQRKLEKFGINATIRREMGQDIDGACGQLRRRHLER